jgi:hypothetical protein
MATSWCKGGCESELSGKEECELHSYVKTTFALHLKLATLPLPVKPGFCLRERSKEMVVGFDEQGLLKDINGCRVPYCIIFLT